MASSGDPPASLEVQLSRVFLAVNSHMKLMVDMDRNGGREISITGCIVKSWRFCEPLYERCKEDSLQILDVLAFYGVYG